MMKLEDGGNAATLKTVTDASATSAATPTEEAAHPERSSGAPAPERSRGGGARWENPYRLLGKARWAVQLAYVAFLVVVCLQFVRFFDQVRGGGAVDAARPPAVEAFLPIAALVAAKRFFLTGYWDAAASPSTCGAGTGAARGSTSRRRRSCCAGRTAPSPGTSP
jgi:hypothetical protein